MFFLLFSSLCFVKFTHCSSKMADNLHTSLAIAEQRLQEAERNLQEATEKGLDPSSVDKSIYASAMNLLASLHNRIAIQGLDELGVSTIITRAFFKNNIISLYGCMYRLQCSFCDFSIRCRIIPFRHWSFGWAVTPLCRCWAYCYFNSMS